MMHEINAPMFQIYTFAKHNNYSNLEPLYKKT